MRRAGLITKIHVSVWLSVSIPWNHTEMRVKFLIQWLNTSVIARRETLRVYWMLRYLFSSKSMRLKMKKIRNYSAIIDIYYQTLNKAWIALYGVLSCFLAVSTIEWSSRKASAPKSERKAQEFFSLIFSLRIPLSLPLLSNGIIGFSRKLKM